MTRWARKRELRGVSRPAFPDRVLSPKAANLMSLMTLSLFSLPFYFIPSTSLPRAFEIAAVHSYPRPPPPTTSGSTPFDIFRRRRVPFGADALALACSSTFALALFLSRPPSPSVTIRRRCRVTRLPLSHPASPHPSFPTSVVAKLCLAVPRRCRRSNPRAHRAHLSLQGHGLP